jgi:hypothetical protein
VTDSRISVLAKVLCAKFDLWYPPHMHICPDGQADAAAILAALPPDWCADPKWQEQYYEGYFGVLGLRADIARLRADNDHLRFIISFHNLTPTGQQRECDPKCIACAALAEWDE